MSLLGRQSRVMQMGEHHPAAAPSAPVCAPWEKLLSRSLAGYCPAHRNTRPVTKRTPSLLTNVCLPRARSRSQYCTLWNEGPNASSKGDLPLHKLLAHSKDSGWFILPLDPFFPQKLRPLSCLVRKAVTHPEKKKKKRGGREKKKGEERKSVTLRLAKARDQQQLPKAESLISLPPGEWLAHPLSRKPLFTKTGINLE